MDAREALLHATLKVYAEAGTRGATTRRIAQEAGVNEVTLFRHFGSKEALIREALGAGAERALAVGLPAHPEDPEAELTAFCRQHHRALAEARSVIRKVMGEFEEHPDACSVACETPVRIANELHAYLVRLRAAGLASGDWNARAAASMLMGALFTDAMGRDCMPERFPYSERDGIRHYVSLFVRAIGAHQAPVDRDQVRSIIRQRADGRRAPR
ncbi:MAG: helix-turn-helix domain-containing protein [Vicinamibacterales bacterium]